MVVIKSFSMLVLASLAAGLFSGCVSTSYTAVKDEPRVSVTFADAQAAKTFYDAYISQNYTKQSYKGLQVAVGLYVESPYWHNNYHYVTDNVLFNRAVAAADTNHDGVINEAEATRFHETIRGSNSIRASDTHLVMIAK
jgi:hypothetical protein